MHTEAFKAGIKKETLSRTTFTGTVVVQCFHAEHGYQTRIDIDKQSSLKNMGSRYWFTSPSFFECVKAGDSITFLATPVKVTGKQEPISIELTDEELVL